MNKYKFANIGIDVFIGKYTNITRPHLIEIGNHNAIDSFFYCSTKLIMKDYIHIAPNVSIIGGEHSFCSMDNFSFIAAGSRIICASEDYTSGGLVGVTIPKEYKASTKYAPVIFERFAGLGSNCVVMPGVTLAEGSVVGAGSVVTKNTSPWSVYYGSPAKLIKFRSQEDIDKTLQYAKEMGYEI